MWSFSLVKKLLIWHFHEFCDDATSSNIRGLRVITPVQSVYPMRIVTDIGKYVTVAAKQTILKELSMKKMVVNIEISESWLFMEEASAWRP